MGLCIDPEDTPHNISFEIREESIVFNDKDIFPEGWAEFDKRFLRKLTNLLTDPAWVEKLGIENVQH